MILNWPVALAELPSTLTNGTDNEQQIQHLVAQEKKILKCGKNIIKLWSKKKNLVRCKIESTYFWN